MVNKTFSRCLCGWGVSFLCLFVVFMAAYSQQVPEKKDTLSRSNYALVIGIDNYKDNSEDWKSLTHAISNAARVGNELESLGFAVTYRINLKLIDIESEIKKFLGNENIDENASLFLWFSGYGHNVGREGFLVPADAPEKDDRAFKMKAFPVGRLEEYLKETKAKHVFLVFDACFTGTIFSDVGSDSPVKTVAEMLKYPVHRYLYCLSASQQEQKKYDGAFGEKFIKTLRNENKADASGDNYLTAVEIKEKMKDFSSKVQLKFGKLKGYDQGDFVFSLPALSIKNFSDPFLKGGGEGPKMSKIPGGSFMMGDRQGNGFRDENPVHLVSVSPIAVSCFEITFAEYELFCKKNNRKIPGDKISGDRPVINVSWQDAKDYTIWLSDQTGFTYRLPKEAEWEYFARAGTNTDYWWGNELVKAKDNKEARAACDGCGARWGWDAEKSTAPVRSFVPNPFGIYDTVGNVWEWTCSEYTPVYNESKKEEYCLERIKNGGEWMVLRGGAWNETPEHCRVSRRKNVNPGERSPYIGFRVVRVLE